MVSMYHFLGYHDKCDFKDFVRLEFDVVKAKQPWFVCPQTDFVLDNNGSLIVDYVGRFENLQDDFDYICRTLGVPQIALPHVNSSSREGDYRSYYDDECVNLVGEIYGSDVKFWAYDF